jgi:ElaB/YqjD/DUF883 family membrane-anchored ribosome-binding protein
MSKIESRPDHRTAKHHDMPDLTVEGAISKATAVASELLESETATQITDLSKEWVAGATKFIKKNPWAAVLGAAAIGFYLGSSRHRGGGR